MSDVSIFTNDPVEKTAPFCTCKESNVAFPLLTSVTTSNNPLNVPVEKIAPFCTWSVSTDVNPLVVTEVV